MMRTWYAEDGSTVDAGKVQGHTHCGSPSTGLTVSLITVGGQQYECSHTLAPTVGDYLVKGGDGEFSLMPEAEFTARYGEDPREEMGKASIAEIEASINRGESGNIKPDGTFERQTGVGGAAPQGESSGTTPSGANPSESAAPSISAAQTTEPVGLTGGFSEVEKPSDTE